MKKIITLLIVLFSLTVTAQKKVGINTNTPAATLQVVGEPAVTTVADGITLPVLTGNELKAKDANYAGSQAGTVVYVSAPASSPTAGKTINVTTAGLYYFNGSVWISFSPGTAIGDTKSGLQSADHNGWIKLDGRAKSTLTATQQVAANALGIGANLPNADNTVLLQNGATLGSTSGSMSKTIVQNQLPNATLSGTTSSNGEHSHSTEFKYNVGSLGTIYQEPVAGHTNSSGSSTWISKTSSNSGLHTHTFTTSSINGNVTQQALDVTPRSLSVNVFIFLGQ